MKTASDVKSMNLSTAIATLKQYLAITHTLYYFNTMTNKRTSASKWAFCVFVPEIISDGTPYTYMRVLTASIFHVKNDGESVPANFKGIHTKGGSADDCAMPALVEALGKEWANKIEFRPLRLANPTV